MLNRQQIKDYRILRGLSTRDVARFCEISQPLIVQIEKGERNLTEYNYREIINGINEAYLAKKNGTLKRKRSNTEWE